jgi:hypothetical protein
MRCRSLVCYSDRCSSSYISLDCVSSNIYCKHSFFLFTGTRSPYILAGQGVYANYVDADLRRAERHHRCVSGCSSYPWLTVRLSRPGSKESCMALWLHAFFLSCEMQIRARSLALDSPRVPLLICSLHRRRYPRLSCMTKAMHDTCPIAYASHVPGIQRLVGPTYCTRCSSSPQLLLHPWRVNLTPFYVLISLPAIHHMNHRT